MPQHSRATSLSFISCLSVHRTFRSSPKRDLLTFIIKHVQCQWYLIYIYSSQSVLCDIPHYDNSAGAQYQNLINRCLPQEDRFLFRVQVLYRFLSHAISLAVSFWLAHQASRLQLLCNNMLLKLLYKLYRIESNLFSECISLHLL